MSSSSRCAACRYLRRRCSEDCVLAPYFPSTHPERFACVHRIFGASNLTRMLQQLPVNERAQAADSISYEAYWRVQDPVYGTVKIISLLQREISMRQCELAETQAQIAMYTARTQGSQQTDQPPPLPLPWFSSFNAGQQQEEPPPLPWFSSFNYTRQQQEEEAPLMPWLSSFNYIYPST